MTDDKEKHVDDHHDCTCEETLEILATMLSALNLLTQQMAKYLETVKFVDKAEQQKHCASEWLLFATLSNLQALAISLQTGDTESLNELRKLSLEIVQKCLPTHNKNITIQ